MNSAKPVRLQLSRRKGFRLQELSIATNGLAAVNVARPTKWGNPYRVAHTTTMASRMGDGKLVHRWLAMTGTTTVIAFDSKPAAIQCAVAHYELYIESLATSWRVKDLRGLNLACWCKPSDPCHADVLLRLANQEQALLVQPGEHDGSEFVR